MLRSCFKFLLFSATIFPNFSFGCKKWFEELNLKNSKDCIVKCTTAKTDFATFTCTNQCDQFCSQKNTKTVDPELNYYDLTEDELIFCKENKYTCLKAYKISWQAEKSCLSIYYKSQTNDESDACRNYLWSFELAKEIGLENAKKILDAHENNPMQDLKEKKMDLENNRNALEDYKENKVASNLHNLVPQSKTG